MRERERHDDERLRPDGAGTEETGGQAEALRAEAARLLEAGGAAIQAVLSGNSEEFLRATRQRGGQ